LAIGSSLMATVLVVDDSPVDRRLAGRLLEKNPQLAVDYAAHGGDALRQMEQRMPDLVLTDLQMPNMDGLRLVETVRRLYPLVPVIIMTAHGSEDVAVKALMSGAAGFVPKGGLGGALVATVESVLTLARKKRGHDRLMDCIGSGEAVLSLPSDRSLFTPLVEHVQHMVSAIGLVDETGSLRVALAMEEALVNALYHGNLGLSAAEIEAANSAFHQSGQDVLPDRLSPALRERKIYVRVQFSREQVTFTIRDEGAGFNPASIPAPTDPLNFSGESPAGRGLVLIRMFMDEVGFNESANEIRLCKRREAE
jgi:CheY-like chemotaxis protein/anti-sigma regulatory factor (Ser/Thr protein kinase)